MSSIVTFAAVIFAILVALAISIGIAYVPMRLLMSQMARNARQFIQRQRDRRSVARETPDRRHV